MVTLINNGVLIRPLVKIFKYCKIFVGCARVILESSTAFSDSGNFPVDFPFFTPPA
jgi:hypothetical protein